MSFSFSPERFECWPETIDLGTEKSNCCSVHCFTAVQGVDGLIQHFLLTFFRDQLLELRHDLVPPRHHRLYFILVQIMLGFFRQFVAIQRLQFLEQLPVAAYQVLGVFSSLWRVEMRG